MQFCPQPWAAPCQTAPQSGCWAGGWCRSQSCPGWPGSSVFPPHWWPWSCPGQRWAHHRTRWQGWSEPQKQETIFSSVHQRCPWHLGQVYQLLCLHILTVQTVRRSNFICYNQLNIFFEILTSLMISSTLWYLVFFGMFASILTRAWNRRCSFTVRVPMNRSSCWT